jgi:hypothetical protein
VPIEDVVAVFRRDESGQPRRRGKGTPSDESEGDA